MLVSAFTIHLITRHYSRTLALKLVDSGCRGIHDMHMSEYQEMLGLTKTKTLDYLKYLTLHSTRKQALEVLVSTYRALHTYQ